MRRAFYTCVYCMWLGFQRNYVVWLEPISLKTQLHAVNAFWKRLSQLCFTHKMMMNLMQGLISIGKGNQLIKIFVRTYLTKKASARRTKFAVRTEFNVPFRFTNFCKNILIWNSRESEWLLFHFDRDRDHLIIRWINNDRSISKSQCHDVRKIIEAIL